jgi:hypothetical protein
MTEHCYAECRLGWLPYSEYHILAPYAECLYAECRHAECRGAVPKYIFIKAFVKLASQIAIPCQWRPL